MTRRTSIEGGGLPVHKQPFPTAVKLGNVVCSSAIGGHDPVTGKVPDSPEEQIRNAFSHVETVLRVAGGSLSDLAKVTVYLRDRSMRDLVNQVWIKLFPNERDRPVRHTVEGEFTGNRIIQVEILAVVRDS
jgi:2-iminobutanoate/2-iminopropanoate deaminase